VFDDVWSYCERTGVTGRTVTVKIKYADFQVVTRSRTFAEPLASRAELEQTSVDLVRSIFPLEKKVRLLGVSLHNLGQREERAVPPQLTLGL
jgi:DNA polymerase-4